MVLKSAATKVAGSYYLVGSPVAVLGDVEEDGIGGGGAVLVFGEVVVFAAPEKDDAVGILL